MYSPDFVRAVREATRAADTFLIADEVFTGLGRTGARFACDLAGVVPDLLCLAKALSGGLLPFGATLAHRAGVLGLPGREEPGAVLRALVLRKPAGRGGGARGARGVPGRGRARPGGAQGAPGEGRLRAHGRDYSRARAPAGPRHGGRGGPGRRGLPVQWRLARVRGGAAARAYRGRWGTPSTSPPRSTSRTQALDELLQGVEDSLREVAGG